MPKRTLLSAKSKEHVSRPWIGKSKLFSVNQYSVMRHLIYTLLYPSTEKHKTRTVQNSRLLHSVRWTVIKRRNRPCRCDRRNECTVYGAFYTVSQKMCRIFATTSSTVKPILKILSLLDTAINYLQNKYNTSCRLW